MSRTSSKETEAAEKKNVGLVKAALESLLRWDHRGGILVTVEGFTGGEIYPDNLAVCYEI